MSTIQSVDNNDSGLDARTKINSNDTNLNNDKLEAGVEQTYTAVQTFGDNIRANRAIVQETGLTKTLALTDADTEQEMNNAAPQTLTVPPNASVAFPIGTEIEIIQLGAGQVTVAEGAGVTINSKGSFLSLTSQYSGAILKKRTTDTWTLIGDLS